jgi:SAM-dependent methyltransferase
MSTFYNRTRRSSSIPKKLLRERKLHLLPVYYLGRTSFLGREAIENSGSYRFADHIYRNQARGRFGIGILLDALLLRLPSARAFRARYQYAGREIQQLIAERPEATDVLCVPCGLARELFDVAAWASAIGLDRPLGLLGVDLDPDLIDQLRRQALSAPRTAGMQLQFSCGDALRAEAYPRKALDMVVSLGFVDFLDGATAAAFYRLVYERLKPGGRFVTSGMRPHRFSDYLLRNVAELRAWYRTADDLRGLARRAGFDALRTYEDATGLQTMLIAERRQ